MIQQLIELCATSTYADCVYYEGRLLVSWHAMEPWVEIQVSSCSKKDGLATRGVVLNGYKLEHVAELNDTERLEEHLTSIALAGITLAGQRIHCYVNI